MDLSSNVSQCNVSLHHLSVVASSRTFWNQCVGARQVQNNVNPTGWLELGSAQVHLIGGEVPNSRPFLGLAFNARRYETVLACLKTAGLVTSSPTDAGSFSASDGAGAEVFVTRRGGNYPDDLPDATLNRIGVEAGDDVSAVADFYSKILGLPEVQLDDIAHRRAERAFLLGTRIGAECTLELLHTASEGQSDERFNVHICLCFARDDLQAIILRARRIGLQVQRSPFLQGVEGAFTVFVEDPAGNIIELTDGPHLQMKRYEAAQSKASAAMK